MGPALLATTVNGDVGDEMACQPWRAKAFWRSPVLGTLVLSEIALVREGLKTDVAHVGFVAGVRADFEADVALERRDHHPGSRRIFGALKTSSRRIFGAPQV